MLYVLGVRDDQLVYLEEKALDDKAQNLESKFKVIFLLVDF